MGNKVEQHIATKEFIELGKKTTICFITLDNGFEVVGTSACKIRRFGYTDLTANSLSKRIRQIGRIILIPGTL